MENKDKFNWSEGEVTIELMQCHNCKYIHPDYKCEVFAKVPKAVRDREIKCLRYDKK